MKYGAGIRYKVTLIICLSALILIITGLSLGYFLGFNLLRNTIGEDRLEIAKRISSAISEMFDEKIIDVRVHVNNSLWKDVIIESNLSYKDIKEEDVRRNLTELNRQWLKDSADAPLVKNVLDNRGSRRLKELCVLRKEVMEILVTDRFGKLVAASGKTTDLYMADQKWWQEAYNKKEGGVFAGDVGLDKPGGVWYFPAAFPIKDKNGDTIGVCRVRLKLQVFFSPLARVKIGRTGSVVLVDNEGSVLFSEGSEPYSIKISGAINLQKFLTGNDKWAVRRGLFGHNSHKRNHFAVFAKIENPSFLESGIIWRIIIDQDIKEAFAPLETLLFQLAAVTGALILILLPIGFIFGGRFVKPIKKLHEATEHIARGELDYPIEIKTRDEIEQLADSFREMISQIKKKEEEILRQKIYAEGIISSMIDTLIVINPDGTLRSVNKAACDLLGYTKEELVGKDVSLIFIEERLFEGKRFRELVEEGSMRNFDTAYKTRSGEKIPVSFSGSVMYESDLDEGNAIRNTQHATRIAGVVGVARDMRETLALISNLKKAKAEIEEFSKAMEKRVEERTKDLAESREAALNIMDDIRESKEELEKTNLELKRAKEEIESFSKSLEEKVKERTAELSILYEVSNAISYTLDYQMLLKLIMESLFKIVDYDICASLLFDAETANITLRPAYSESAKFMDEVKKGLINSVSVLTGETIREKRMSVFFIPLEPNAKPKENRQFDELRSFFNVPFVVGGRTVGMINVSSCSDNAFSEDNIKIIYTIANQAANAIEHLQAVITAEKSKMESMVESMTEGVMMIDGRGEIAVLNPQGRRMIGLALTEELDSGHLMERMKAIDLYKAFQECQNKERVITKEIVLTQKEESVVLRCDISPVKDMNARVIGIVIVLRDISREKEIDRMKTEFISTVSHELRTPLTTMKAFASIILDEIGGKLTKKQKEYLGIIKNNIDRLNRLINDLLDISKIESGKMEFHKKSLDLIDLAKAVVSTLKPEAEEKHLELKTLFPDSATNIYADPDKIVQVFVNLIGNAIKFTPEQGKITVEIKDTEKDVECSVTDTGKGIAPEDMDKLFTKFQQFGRVSGSGAKGTGLGLAISKELVQAHSGRIWAESEFQKGSKFIFTLPKYSLEDILYETVERRITRAKKENNEFSLLIVRLDDYSEDKKEFEKNGAQKAFLPISAALEKVVRSDDFVTSENAFIAFVQVNKEDVLKVIRRFKLEIKLPAFEIEEQFKMGLSFGCAAYPADADQAKDLVDQAYKSCVQEKEGRLKKNIMIVDDEPEVIDTLKRILQANGYSNFSEAGDGEEALEKIKIAIPDLLILDMKMPKMNGYELIGMLKENMETKDIPVLIMSRHSIEVEKLDESVRKKAIPVLGKPFNIEQIRMLVNYLL